MTKHKHCKVLKYADDTVIIGLFNEKDEVENDVKYSLYEKIFITL